MRAGYRPQRSEYLHRACCDVSDLITEIESWLMRWPLVMAVAAEGAQLHPGIMELYYSSELPKHVSSLFTFEAIRGCGMGVLAEFKQEGE